MVVTKKKKSTKKKAKKTILHKPSKVRGRNSSAAMQEQNLLDEELFKMHPSKAALRQKRIHGNKEKKKIALDMLERYTGHPSSLFQKQIILTNFRYYTERFQVLLHDAIFTMCSVYRLVLCLRSMWSNLGDTYSTLGS